MDIRRCFAASFVLVIAFESALALTVDEGPDASDTQSTSLGAEPKWPTLGGTFRRDGQSPDAGPLTGDVRWRFETAGPVVGSVTVGCEGCIHVASEDGRLYTLDPNGNLLWICDVNCPLLSAPSIGSDGSLYVGGRDGRLFAITSEGQQLWTYLAGDVIYSSPAVGATGQVYLGVSDGTLRALDGQTGEELWRFKTKGPWAQSNGAVFASPAIGSDGTIYIAGLYDPNLYALNPADGSTKWVCRFPANSDDPNTGGWPFVSPVVAKDGTIYQTLLYDPNLYAIDPAGGTILWSVNLCDPYVFGGSTSAPTASDGWSEPVVAPDGTIYVSLDDPYLRAIHPSGVLQWVAQLGGVGGFTLTVDNRGIVYAAADDGQVYAVSPGGLVFAQFETGGWPAFPVIAAEDLLILADSRDYSLLNTDEKNAIYAIASMSYATQR